MLSIVREVQAYISVLCFTLSLNIPGHCTPVETSTSFKAYTKTTLNPLVGADHDFLVFSNEVMQRMEVILPQNVEE